MIIMVIYVIIIIICLLIVFAIIIVIVTAVVNTGIRRADPKKKLKRGAVVNKTKPLQLLAKNPGLVCVNFRGSVQTRIPRRELTTTKK